MRYASQTDVKGRPYISIYTYVDIYVHICIPPSLSLSPPLSLSLYHSLSPSIGSLRSLVFLVPILASMLKGGGQGTK